MQLYEMIFWLALILFVTACVGISAIGLRNSTWFGTYRSPSIQFEASRYQDRKSFCGIVFCWWTSFCYRFLVEVK